MSGLTPERGPSCAPRFEIVPDVGGAGFQAFALLDRTAEPACRLGPFALADLYALEHACHAAITRATRQKSTAFEGAERAV